MAWDSQFRQVESVVLLGMQDITRHVRGAITLDRSTGSTVATGALPLKNSALAWYAPGSWSVGPQQVEIWVRERGESWTRLFRGVAEIPEDSELWVPAGTLRLVSHSQAWANQPLCLLTSPFGGATRAELVVQAIGIAGLKDTAGYPVAVTGTWPGGRQITRPQDFSGVTLPEILRRWGEVEGGSFRETDGGFELLDLAGCWGPGVTPLWDFTRYVSITETGPGRPVTHWIFSGTEPKLPDDGTTVTVKPDDPEDPTGPRTELTITVTDGVITQEIEERYDLYVVKGVTNAAEELLLVKRVTTDREFALNVDLKPTGRLTTQTVTTESYYAPLASTGTGDPPYTFEDGSFHTQSAETFQETELVTEGYEWDEGKCLVKSGVIETKSWTAPLSESISSDPENTWTADSSVRSQTEETYQVVSRRKWRENLWEPGDPWSQDLSLYFHTAVLNGGRVRFRVEGAERGMENGTNTQFRRNYESAIAWIESADRLSHQVWTRRWTGSTADTPGCSDLLSLMVGEEAGLAGTTPLETYEPIPEPIPLPPMESGTSMVYALRPWVTTLVVTTPLPEVIQSEELLDAETVEEAQRAGRDRCRRGLAVRETMLVARADPNWRLYDPVRFTGAARNCTLRQGWIEQIQLSLDPASGEFKAPRLVVAIDPFPAVAP